MREFRALTRGLDTLSPARSLQRGSRSPLMIDQLEEEAQAKGGIQQLLANHFAKVYKMSLPVGRVAT